MECKNCGHKIVDTTKSVALRGVPLKYIKERYSHQLTRGLKEICGVDKCRCTQPEPKKEVSSHSSPK